MEYDVWYIPSGMEAEAPSFVFSPDRVKHIRISLGETQEVFAQRLGVAANMVSRWETGESAPRHGRIIKALLEAEAKAEEAVRS